jgi:hypothetical protein
MFESASPPALPEVFLERVLPRSDGNEPDSGASGPLRLRIYKPVERTPDRWGCTLEFQSARDPESPRRIEFTGQDSTQALFYALQVAEGIAGRRYVPTPPDVFVERILDYADGEAVRPVTVRIYKPVQHGPEEWECIMEFQGLHPSEQPYRHEVRGADGVHALFEGLRMAGVEIDRYKGKLSWFESHPWETTGFRDGS